MRFDGDRVRQAAEGSVAGNYSTITYSCEQYHGGSNARNLQKLVKLLAAGEWFYYPNWRPKDMYTLEPIAKNSRIKSAPDFLRPEVDWAALKKGSVLFAMSWRAAQTYGVSEQNAAAAIFNALGAAAGAGFVIEMGATRLLPGYNLVTVTESGTDPAWRRVVPGVYTEELQEKISVIESAMWRRESCRVGTEIGTGPEEYWRGSLEGALKTYFGLHRQTISHSLVVRSFRQKTLARAIMGSPDHQILIENPPGGILSEIRNLSPRELATFPSLLTGSIDAGLHGPRECYALGGARLTLELSPSEARSLLELPRMADTETLFVAATNSSVKNLVALPPQTEGVLRPFLRWFTAERLRRAATGQPRVVKVTALPEYKQFFEQAFAWENSSENKLHLPVLWLLRLALKLSLLHFVFPGSSEPEIGRSLRVGLELAKYLGMEHIAVLSSILIPETVATAIANLTERERAVFLRICQRGPISGPELSRSFHRLGYSERMGIVCKLVEVGLVEYKDNSIRKIQAKYAMAM